MDSRDLQHMGFKRLCLIGELKARLQALASPDLDLCGVYALVTPPGY